MMSRMRAAAASESLIAFGSSRFGLVCVVVVLSKMFLGDSSFIVHLGDNLLKDSIPEMAKEFQSSGADAAVVISRVKDPSRFGVVQIEKGKIVKLVEKPKQFISDLALAGVYFFRPTIFPAIE